MKNLICLSLASLILGCNQGAPKSNSFIVDISSSNSSTINESLKRIEDLYLESGPNDTFQVYFFSSAKYLAYSGSKLSKDREFKELINEGYQKAKKIEVKSGTSFNVCKEILESSAGNIVLLTDGYFENSTLSKVKLKKQSTLKIIGLNIANNERILNCFEDSSQISVDFKKL